MSNPVLCLLAATLALLAASCQPVPVAIPTAAPVAKPDELLLQDFEQPATSVVYLDGAPLADDLRAWLPTAATSRPATLPGAASWTRVPNHPHAGLWAAEARVGARGTFLMPTGHALDLASFDTLVLHALQDSGPDHSGTLTAAAFLLDTTGRIATGDAYPLSTRWQAIPLDLRAAAARVSLDHIAAVGLELRSTRSEEAPARLTVQTDSWLARRAAHTYVGDPAAPPGQFYVYRQGPQLHLGKTGHFELTFHNRAVPAGKSAAWMSVRQANTATHPGLRQALGEPGTGLVLLDQAAFDSLGDAVQEKPPTGKPPHGEAALLPVAWPGTLSTYEWNVVWTSPLAALVEVKQTAGPYDALGRPALVATWRFMVYHTGQLFGSLEWRHEGTGHVATPITLALILDRATPAPTEPPADAALRQLYPEALRTSVLPHQLQTGSPIALLAKTPDTGDQLCWRAELPAGQGKTHRIFGIGLPVAMRRGPLAWMMLLDAPTARDQAAAFSAYLAPPRLDLRLGRLDRTFPGDLDNDGLVDLYGFLPIRLAAGRTAFTLDPESRPLFYPTFLLTIPLEERAKTNLAKFDLLLNIDGQQLASPARWPDGSFLVQLPWQISKPVKVEAALVPK